MNNKRSLPSYSKGLLLSYKQIVLKAFWNISCGTHLKFEIYSDIAQ